MNSLIDSMRFIEENEGFRPKIYKCTAGFNTIGFGRNLDTVGISRIEAEQMMYHDILEATRDLMEIFPKWNTFNRDQQTALIDMRYNLGGAGFRTFQNLINCVRNGMWREAANQAINSKWYGQVGGRADRVVGLLLK